MVRHKLVIPFLAGTLLLSGCTKQLEQTKDLTTPKDEGVKLTVWGGKKDFELLSGMIESFKNTYADQANFEITIESVEEGECKERILEEVNAAPDVFSFADDQLAELAAAGVLAALPEEEAIRNNNLESAVEAASINGKLYAYPMTADNGYFMYYNKKYFSEEEVQSLDVMLEKASALNKKVAMTMTSGWYLYTFFGNSGLELGLNQDGLTNYCNWNSTTGAVKGADIGNALLKIASHPGFMNVDDTGVVEGAKTDTVIAGISGVWDDSLLKGIWGEDLAAAKLPTYSCAGNEVQMASYAGYKLVGVNDYSLEKEWAAKLADWLTNEENQKLRFMERGLGPSNTVAANLEEVKESPAIQALIAQSQYSSLQRVGAEYWDAASDFASKLLNGEATPGNMQILMDNMVGKITTQVTDK